MANFKNPGELADTIINENKYTPNPKIDWIYTRNLYDIMKKKGLDENQITDVFKTSGLSDDDLNYLKGSEK